jgi:hypothetical protein
MQSSATVSPMAQITSTRGKLGLTSEAFSPKAAKVAKKTTKASKLSAIDPSARFDDLLLNATLILFAVVQIF